MEIVQLPSYNIYIGPASKSLADLLAKNQYSKLMLIVDENTSQHCLPLIQDVLSSYDWTSIRIPSGEQHKNIDTCQLIWRQMMEASADRKALTINLGGGVIGDMGGFCAGTFKRGMDFVQIPTTLLSQVDASIGGKLGVDFMQVKNSIGLFRDPQAVLIDPEFLKTLSFAETRSGFAEIIKHSLIADADQWASLCQIKDLSHTDWGNIIPPSLLIKKNIVEADPFERGIRKALNFGHTIGHAIEGHALESGQPLLHGEAIAIGMICEAYLSHKLLGLPQKNLNEICRFLLSTYEPHPLNKANYPIYFNLMRNDKKNEQGAINFSLINPIGQAQINQTSSEEMILDSLDYYNMVSRFHGHSVSRSNDV